MFLELEIICRGEILAWVAVECRKACAEDLLSVTCPRSCGCRRALGSSSYLGALEKASDIVPDMYTCGRGLGDPTLFPWGAHPKQTYEVPLFKVLTSTPSPRSCRSRLMS